MFPYNQFQKQSIGKYESGEARDLRIPSIKRKRNARSWWNIFRL